MPTIGYCHDCQEWVWVGVSLECPNGHEAARVNGWYDSETGDPVVPTPGSSSAVPAAPAHAKAAPDLVTSCGAFTADLIATLAHNHAYHACPGPDADVTIASNPVDASWGAGDKKTEYAAALKAVEADRTVYFWESLKARSEDTFGLLEPESYSDGGAKRSGTKHDAGIGPGSTSWEWGFGTLLGVVEEVAARHGFSVRVVLSRQAASW